VIGFIILLGYNAVGYLLHQFAGIPLPANVIGLMLLVLSLNRGWVKLEWVEESAQFLVKHMMVLFAPLIVGVIVFFSLIRAEWLIISGSLVGSTIIVLLLTGWATTRMAKPKQEVVHESSRIDV
jgi:holin-like protein